MTQTQEANERYHRIVDELWKSEKDRRLAALLPSLPSCECTHAVITEFYNRTNGHDADGSGAWGVLAANPPRDFGQWHHFPELQEYVLSLSEDKQDAVLSLLRWIAITPDGGETGGEYGVLDITPTILGNAILEVCDAEQPEPVSYRVQDKDNSP